MRLAVLADIHGNLPALEAVVRDVERRGVDMVVQLGDVATGPLMPRETVQFVMDQPWVQIAGNGERELIMQRPEQRSASAAFARSQLTELELRWMASLPATAVLDTDVLLCHGTPSSDTVSLLETIEPRGVRLATLEEIAVRLGGAVHSLVLCGHTHVPRSVRVSPSQQVANPGSIGLPAYDDDSPIPHVMETGSPDARYAIVERDTSGWVVNLLSVPYDNRAMADLAASRGRRDWEIALRTGYAQRIGEAERRRG